MAAALLLAVGPLGAEGRSIHDATAYPLVWNEPGAHAVETRSDLPYAATATRTLHLDLALPAGERSEGGWPAVLLVSGFGDAGPGALKDWPIYRSWLRTLAARGYVAAMGESDPDDVAGSLRSELSWLVEHAGELGVDRERLAIWGVSANVPKAFELATSPPERVRPRDAILLYGSDDGASVPADLPVLLVVAGRDSARLVASERRLVARAVEAGAPWTVIEAPTLPHAFDAVDRSEESRRVVGEILGWLDARLKPIPAAPAEGEEERAAREALAHLFGQEFEAAHAYYNELSKEEGETDPHFWLDLAWAREGLEDRVGQLLALEKASAVAPEDLAIRRRFTRLAASLGGWDMVEEGLGAVEGSTALDRDDLGLLGLARLRLGRPADAVAPLERAVALGAPEGTRYNLACALALAGRKEEALAALGGAIDAGFRDRAAIERDADFASLRVDPRFAALLDAKLPVATEETEGSTPP